MQVNKFAQIYISTKKKTCQLKKKKSNEGLPQINIHKVLKCKTEIYLEIMCKFMLHKTENK